MKVALLNDYQGVAMGLAPWDQLPAGTEVSAFTDHQFDEDAVAERLRDFDIVMALRERTPFPRSLLERLPKLKLLVTAGPRNAAIDTAACIELGILVCGTGGSVRTTMELTWGLIFAVTRRIPQAHAELQRGIWQGGPPGIALEGRTLGLIGLGRIGSQMAGIARAFGMEVIAWSENLTEARAAECGARRVSKEELLRTADIVSVHVVLGERTRGMIGAAELALMRPTAYLVNTSRGPIVEEAALVAALRDGTIAGAGLDVFDREPLPPDHPLLSLENAVLTPHLGYVTEEVYRVFYRETLEDIQAYLRGEPLRVINPDVLGHRRPREG